MFWFRFRRTSDWAGGTFKAFFYNQPIAIGPNAVVPGNDTAVSSFTRPQLEAFVEAGKAALAAWPAGV